jgi:hypothetical protein
MRQVTVQSLLSLVLVAALAAAQNPAIGLAMAKGSFRVDNSQVWNNATLLEGTTIETARVASQLHLNSGTQLELAAESRGKVYRDRLILERGVGQLENSTSYRIEARGLKVFAAGANAAAQVGFDKENRVVVAARNGPVRVTTAAGIVVANVEPGAPLAFLPQVAGAAPPAKLRGCVEKKNGRFLLTDETTKVRVELVGPGLEAEVGNVIELEGVTDLAAKPAAGASQVVKVSTMKRVGTCKAVPAVPPVPPPAAAAGGWAALSAGAKVAIIAGVAVGASLGIMRAAGVFEEEKKPISP